MLRWRFSSYSEKYCKMVSSKRVLAYDLKKNGFLFTVSISWYPSKSAHPPPSPHRHVRRHRSKFCWLVLLVGTPRSWSTGWWLSHPSEKYDFVSWDDEIPNIYGNKNVPNHQPETIYRHVWWICIKDHQGPPKKSPNREINSQGWWLKLLRIDDRNSGKDWRFMSSNTEMLSNFFDCTCGKSCLGSLSTAQVLFLLFGFFVPKINTRKWAKWSFISRSCSKIVPELKLRCNP